MDLDFVFTYIDDILIASSTSEEHEKRLATVFTRLREFSLRINVDEYQFGVPELKFLGYKINSEGCSPISDKVKAILDFPNPKNILELRRFLDMVNFYCRCLPHTVGTQAPLHGYLCDSRSATNAKFLGIRSRKPLSNKLRNYLVSATLLVHPSHDAEIRIVTDASNFDIGVFLEQSIKNQWKPLAFFSRKFNSAQLTFNAYDRELTAIYEAIRHFRYFLEGRIFKLVTDHKPNIYAFTQKAEKFHNANKGKNSLYFSIYHVHRTPSRHGEHCSRFLV